MALVMNPAGINTYEVGAFDAKNYSAEYLCHQRILNRCKRMSELSKNVKPLIAADLKELKNQGRKH